MPPGRLRWLPRQNIAPAAQFPVTMADRPVESPWPIIHHFAVDVYTLDHGPLESAHWSLAWAFADRQSVQSDFLKFAFAVNYTCSSESCGFQAMEWERCRCKRFSIFLFFFPLIFDGFVKSLKSSIDVIPAKAGIQCFHIVLDACLRRHDGISELLQVCQFTIFKVPIYVSAFFRTSCIFSMVIRSGL